MALTPTALLSDIKLIADVLQLGSRIDVVAIFDAQSFQQVFSDGRPLKAVVKETSKFMEHPAENGVSLADHHIINPVEIEMAMIISQDFYSSVYQQIRAAFINATRLSVQTRTGVYQNMILANLPHDESPDVYDSITIGLHFKQVIFEPNPSTYAPVDPVNSDTVQNGLQSAGALTTQAVAAVGALASYASLAGKF